MTYRNDEQSNIPAIHPTSRAGFLAERAVISDCRFFEKFPHHTSRARLAHDAEIEQFMATGMLKPLPEGHRWWMLVRNIFPGCRTRQPIALPIGADMTDMINPEVLGR